jgi:glycosyltransferase involved in cell wall biosynthesis
MISVIICSRSSEINPIFFKNITEKIGSQHELIVIDNSQNKYSIFEAYNIGIAQSKGDYWCFIHDDILFHSQDWGKIIQRIFEEDLKVGLIGVAGTKVKTKMPSAWWDCPENLKVLNIIQHLPSGAVEHWQKGFPKNKIEEVVVIDGVFMAARRLNTIRFSNTFKGFHNYDLNLCLEYLKKEYKVVVATEILLEHFSMGSINSSWYQSTIKVHNHYRKILPLRFDNRKDFNFKKLEFDNGVKFLLDSRKEVNKWTFVKTWIKLIQLKPKSKFHFTFLKLLFK